MPLMMVWPESSSVRTLKVGSSSASRDSAIAHLFLVGLGLGLDGHRNHRLREGNGAQRDGMMRRAKRIAGLQFLQPHAGADVAGQNLGDVFALVGVHLHQAPNAIGPAGTRIQHRVAGLERARIDAHKAELAEWIVDDLEGQRRQRLAVVGLADHNLVVMRGIDALHRRLVQRAGQIIDHRVQQRLNALVLEGASADHREDLQIDGGLANAGLQFVDGRRLAFEKLLQQHIVGLGDHFNQLQAEGLCLLLQVGGNRLNGVLARPWFRRATEPPSSRSGRRRP